MFRVFRFAAAGLTMVPAAALAQVSDPAAPLSPMVESATIAPLDLSAMGARVGADEPPLVGPALPRQRGFAQGDAPRADRGHDFGSRVDSVKWETLAALGVLTYTNVNSVNGETQGFRFVNEGYFGRDTGQLGLDKLAHAWNGYVFTDVLYKRMARKVGGGAKAAWTAAALGMTLQTYGEIFDGFHRGSGFSWQDMLFNAAGVGFSVVRHTVPGVAEKVDFRTYFVPVDRPEGLGDPDRFEKQRFLLAVKGSGFAVVRDTPLRFAELHLGYRGKNFSKTDRQIGLVPERRIFVGVGLNLSELLFRNRRGPVASVGRSALEYFQLPYTAAHADLTR